MTADFIIVGQGIAGTCLAHTLIQKGASVIIIDKERANTSSKIAAGLLNPIALKRLTKSWRAEEFFPFAKTFYTQLEELLDKSFYHLTPIVKIFGNIAEQNDWLAKSATEVLGQFMSSELVELNEPFKAPFGAGQVLHCGWLDTPAFLAASRKYFQENAEVIDESFEYDKLELNDEFVNYKTLKARHVIFCEGHAVQENPLFNWLPFTPNKGEVLTIETNALPTEKIHNKKCFVLPQEGQRFKVGSTYNWRTPNTGTTQEGKEELMGKLLEMADVNYNIVNHQSAIRPAVKDRKPIIGQHPKHEKVFIFNGMGSKGVTMAPFFANQLVAAINRKDELDKEVSIERFEKLLK